MTNKRHCFSLSVFQYNIIGKFLPGEIGLSYVRFPLAVAKVAQCPLLDSVIKGRFAVLGWSSHWGRQQINSQDHNLLPWLLGLRCQYGDIPQWYVCWGLFFPTTSQRPSSRLQTICFSWSSYQLQTQHQLRKKTWSGTAPVGSFLMQNLGASCDQTLPSLCALFLHPVKWRGLWHSLFVDYGTGEMSREAGGWPAGGIAVGPNTIRNLRN